MRSSLRKLPLPLLVMLSMLFGAMLTGTAFAVQTHMWTARTELMEARQQLLAAMPDKAGHRLKAVSLVNAAIAQVNAGIAAGAR